MPQYAELEAAARHLADAIAAHDAARAEHGRATDQAAMVQQRLAAAQAARAAIVHRRQRGDVGDADGAHLATLGADIEGLEALLREAEAEVAPRGAALDQARAVQARARQDLDGIEAARAIAAEVAFADKLAAELLACVDRLQAIKDRRRSPLFLWFPPPGLGDKLYRLDLNRPGGLR